MSRFQTYTLGFKVFNNPLHIISVKIMIQIVM